MNNKALPRLIALVFLLMGMISLLACSGNDENSDLTNKTSKIKQEALKKKKVDQEAAPSLPQKVTFSGDNLQAPFAKRQQIGPGQQGTVSSPLMAFPINVLTLVGTISEDDAIFAYVATPDQMIYRLNVGDIVGQKKGRVVSIEPGRVEVVVLDAQDGEEPVQRRVILELKDEPE